MSPKIVVLIIVMAVFLVFIGFNLNNRCDISFGFIVLESVPVFLTAFASFGIGLICAIPFAIRSRGKKSRNAGESIPAPAKGRKQKKQAALESTPPAPSDGDSAHKESE